MKSKESVKIIPYQNTLALATLITKGQIELFRIEHVDRGYENLDGRLRELGARIKRLE